MIEAHSFTGITGKPQAGHLNKAQVSKPRRIQNALEGTRIFVPFTGFDGQALAGSGALVFEGELLKLKN